MQEPTLTVKYHVTRAGGGEDRLVFADWNAGNRLEHEYISVLIADGSRVHIYPDAVLLFADGATEGVYLHKIE